MVSQPSSGEEAMQICEALVKSNAVDVVIVDSVAVSRAQARIGRGDWRFARRSASEIDEPIDAEVDRGDFPKQDGGDSHQSDPREDCVMFGNPETTPGGRALKFYASCRIDVRRIGALKEGESRLGSGALQRS